jgi:hypothetical protein
MSSTWLADEENVAALYAISKQVVEKLAPIEAVIFDELFEDYLEAARQGAIEVGVRPDEAFTLGSDDLIALIVIPLVANILSNLLADYGLSKIREWRSRRDLANSPDPVHLKSSIDKAFHQQGRPLAGQEELIALLTTLIIQQLSTSNANQATVEDESLSNF